jgi:hypothetical protein
MAAVIAFAKSVRVWNMAEGDSCSGLMMSGRGDMWKRVNLFGISRIVGAGACARRA